MIILCVLAFFAGFYVLLVDREASRFSLYLGGMMSGGSLIAMIVWWRAMKLP